MARLLRAGEKDDGRFDTELWQRQGAEAIFAASWEIVNEARAMRGLDGDEPDFRDLFVALSDAGADFIVVGAHAVMFYTEPSPRRSGLLMITLR